MYGLIYQAQAYIDKFDYEYYYTETYQQHIDEALRIYGTRVTTQPEITNIENVLTTDISTTPTEKDGDYSSLGSILMEIDQNLYTPDSWTVFEPTYNEALDMYENRPYKKKDQREIDKQVNKLIQAKEKLDYKQADYSRLQAAITKAEATRDTQQMVREKLTYIYTDNSRNALTEEIGKVDWDLNITQQAQVDAYQTTIESYEQALELKEAKYDLVNEAIRNARLKEAETYKGEPIYTDECIAEVEALIAVVVENKKITEQQEVDGWADSINTVKWIEKKADYTEVDAALEEAEATRDKQVSARGEQVYQYTSESREAFNVEISKIDDDLPIYKQETVDGYMGLINDALKLLVEVDADYTDINNLINEVTNGISKKYHEEFIYTNETITILTGIINSVEQGLKIKDQDALDAKQAELETAYIHGEKNQLIMM